jgi:hypothetical protein
MPIAIYRHLKLTVAVSRYYDSSVVGFYPRRMQRLGMNITLDGHWRTSLAFHTLSRQRELRIRKREVWQFEKGIFTFIQERYRNDRLIHTLSSKIPPASSLAWTENGVIRPIYQQFENELAARSIVELYLHHHTPNPHDYMVVQLDLNPATADQPPVTSWFLPPLEVSEMNAELDKSETSHQWAKLFLE